MANPFAFATVNHIRLALGIPHVSLVQGDLVLFIQDLPDFCREIRVAEWLENDLDAGI